MRKIIGQIREIGNGTSFDGGQGGYEYTVIQVDEQLLQKVKVSQSLDNFLKKARSSSDKVMLWTIYDNKKNRLVGIEFPDGKRYVTGWWQMKPITGMILATIGLALVVPGVVLWGYLLFVGLPMYRSYRSLIDEHSGTIVLDAS